MKTENLGKKTMRSLKITFLSFTLFGLLAACTNNSQPLANSTSPDAQPMQTMDHGTMNHGAMSLGPADADFDLRFIDAMTPHHEGAIVMAKEAQQKSQRPEIKKLSNQIIQDQAKEIAEMKAWRKKWYANANETPMAYDAKMGHMMEMSKEQKASMMMQQDLGQANANFDQRFITAMTPHHKGAIDMAKEALSKSKRPEVKQLAAAIITSQEAEIKQMQQWQRDWYKQ